jgi:hypothetical protein
LWFSAYFLLNFNQYRSIFLYYKDTNPVLKYLVFSKVLQKKTTQKKKRCLVFMHTVKSLKKKIILYFHTTKKTSKNMF